MITRTFVTQIRTIFDEKYHILSCKSQSTFEVKNNNQENIEPNIIDKKKTLEKNVVQSQTYKYCV